MTALRRLRSWTEASESKPRSRKALLPSMTSAEAWPRTVATRVRTRSTTAPRRSAAGRAASCAAREVVSSSGSCAAAARRGGVRTSWRSSGGTGSAEARRTGRSRRIRTSSGSGAHSARSNSARPCSTVRGGMPERAMRRRSASSRWPVIALAGSHRDQARDCAGSPAARRCWASASRWALAAA